MKKITYLSAVTGILLLVSATAWAQAPANDACSGAKMLSVASDTTCNAITDSLAGAKDELGASTCSGNTSPAAFDVWYKFTATGTRQVIKVNSAKMGMVVIVYDACGGNTVVCGNPRFVVFGGNTFAIRGLTTVIASGLTNGHTYLVRVYNYNTTVPVGSAFTICVSTPPNPPANDVCANAATLVARTDTTCASVTGTLLGANQESAADSCAGVSKSPTAYDVWYKFVATATKHIIDVTSASNGLEAVLYAGCGGNTIACANPQTFFGVARPGTSQIAANGLSIGTTYYLRVYNYGGAVTQNGSFTVCVHGVPAAPVNDICVNAIAITPETTDTCSGPTPGTLLGANQESAADSCAGISKSPSAYDVWYKFTANANAQDIEVNSTSVAGVIILYNSNGGNCGSVNTCANPRSFFGTAVPGKTRLKAFGLTAGNHYFVRVYHYGNTVPTKPNFTICIYRDSAATLGVDNVKPLSQSLEIYPNPARDQLNVAFNVSSAVSIKMENMNGQMVYNENYGTFSGTFNKTIDMTNMAKGIYMLQITTDKETINRKVVRE